MASPKITYIDKVDVTTPIGLAINNWVAANENEIKAVVNAHSDDIDLDTNSVNLFLRQFIKTITTVSANKTLNNNDYAKLFRCINISDVTFTIDNNLIPDLSAVFFQRLEGNVYIQFGAGVENNGVFVTDNKYKIETKYGVACIFKYSNKYLVFGNLELGNKSSLFSIVITSPFNAEDVAKEIDTNVVFMYNNPPLPDISVVDLIVDGVVFESRAGSSTADFVIPADTFSLGSHTVKIIAYDVYSAVLAESNLVSFNAIEGSIFANGLLTGGLGSTASAVSTIFDAQKIFTISVFVNINSNFSDGPILSYKRNSVDRVQLFVSGGGFLFFDVAYSSLYSVKYDISGLSNGVHHFLVAQDANQTGIAKTNLFIDGDLKTLTSVDLSGGGYITSSSGAHTLLIGGSAKSLQSNLSIDIGRFGTLTDAGNLWNGGRGEYYAIAVRTPTSYYEMDQTDVDTTLIDSISANDLALSGFGGTKFVDFVNYVKPIIPIPPLNFGKGLLSDGTDDLLQNNNWYNFTSIRKITMGGWFKIKSGDVNGLGITLGKGPQYRLELYYNGSVFGIVHRSDTVTNLISVSNTLVPGIYFAALSVDLDAADPNDVYKLYLNTDRIVGFTNPYATPSDLMGTSDANIIMAKPSYIAVPKNLMTNVFIDIGNAATELELYNTYVQGSDSDYATETGRTPYAYFDCQQVDTDTSLINSGSGGTDKNVPMSNYNAPIFVDFNSY